MNDVSTLGNVHTLDLTGTEVVDVSALENVHTLLFGPPKRRYFKAYDNKRRNGLHRRVPRLRDRGHRFGECTF